MVFEIPYDPVNYFRIPGQAYVAVIVSTVFQHCRIVRQNLHLCTGKH